MATSDDASMGWGPSDVPPLFGSLPPDLALLTVLDRPDLLQKLCQQVDWDRVVGLARYHRVSGTLATALETAPGERLAPGTVGTEVLAERDQRRTRFETEVLPQLAEVCDALVVAGVVPTLLKGAALICSGVTSSGERPIGDIDLLVRRPALDATTLVLEDLGYRTRVPAHVRAWARAHHYQDPAWYREDRPLGVEVHWRIQESQHRLAFDESTLETLELTLPGPTRVQRLSDRDLLTHLALHFWRDRAEGRPGSLGQLWDVRRASPPQDHEFWVGLRASAVHRGHPQVLAAVLACSHLILGGPLPDGFPEVAGMTQASATSAYAIRRVLAPRPMTAQLLMVTPDVDYQARRVLNRVAAQFRKPPAHLRETYGDGAAWRLRLHHARHLSRLLVELGRSPADARAELRLDRWAHQLR